MKMLSITTELNDTRVDVSIWADTYGDRFNVKRVNILAETYCGDSDVNDGDLDSLENDVFWEISNEEGEWYDRFTELAQDNGLSEVCVVGKY
jgi:hypothetical protein